MKILLATDGTEAAIRAGRGLVSMLAAGGSTVRIITVLSYGLSPYTGIPDEPLADEAERKQHVREEIRRITEIPQRELEEAGFEVEVVHRFGNPTEEIATEIREWDPDLVAMGRRAVHGLERWIGSVSEHVLHHTEVPLLLVP